MSDRSPTFEEMATKVARSVIAIAIGTRLDGLPNIVGTGFGLEKSEYFATCWHVASEYDRLIGLDKKELAKEELKDNIFRISIRAEDDSYNWHEVKRGTLMRSIKEDHDVCIFRIIGLDIPPLYLLPNDQWPWGSEVGIIGFPMGNTLQGVILRPYILKTIVSGALEYPMKSGIRSPRVALGCAIAGGFSGSPVFSAQDGQVMGMIDQTVLEGDEWGSQWPAGISTAIAPSLIRKGMKSHIKATNERINESLWPGK